MFNDMDWGGYLMLMLPEHKVFMYSNLDVCDAALIKEYNEVDDVHPGWADVFHKYDVGWTILPAAHPLNCVLVLRHDWKIAYTDEVTTIYARLP
jgi:hypothetical protein